MLAYMLVYKYIYHINTVIMFFKTVNTVLLVVFVQTMKEQAKNYSTEIKQIDLDVNRTFRNHIMFMDRFGVK